MFLKGCIIPYLCCLDLVVVHYLVVGFLGHRSLHGLSHVRYGILYLCDQLLS